MSRKIILVKLGGSLITNKSKAFSERRDIITDLVGQVKKAREKNGFRIIVGHGGGSYPHVPAEKYKTIEGNINKESIYGAAMVEDAAAQLNRIIVGEFLKQKVSAVSVNPSSLLALEGGKVKAVFLDSLVEMLELNVIPVVYGDVIFDSEKGFTIWSTERLLSLLARELVKRKRRVEKIIHCGETDGVIVEGKVVKEIRADNFGEIAKSIYRTEGFDVTGGMMHKVEESLEMAQDGIDSYIVGGNHGGNMYRAVVGDNFIGTKITAR